MSRARRLHSRFSNPFYRPGHAAERRLRSRLLLHSSTAAVTDCHLLAFDDDRHVAAALAGGQHPLKTSRVLLDDDVFHSESTLREVRTGFSRVGSGVFTEDGDVGHVVILCKQAH